MDIRMEPSNPAAAADPISACGDNPSESPATGTPDRHGKTARTRKTTSTEHGDHDLARHTRDKTGPPPLLSRHVRRPARRAMRGCRRRSVPRRSDRPHCSTDSPRRTAVVNNPTATTGHGYQGGPPVAQPLRQPGLHHHSRSKSQSGLSLTICSHRAGRTNNDQPRPPLSTPLERSGRTSQRGPQFRQLAQPCHPRPRTTNPPRSKSGSPMGSSSHTDRSEQPPTTDQCPNPTGRDTGP
jgi:hypothetical protein